MPLGPTTNPRLSFQAYIPSPCSCITPYGGHLSHTQDSTCPPEGNHIIWSFTKPPEQEKTPWPQEATHTHTASLVDINSSLSECLTLTLTSESIASPHICRSVIHALDTNQKPSLGFRLLYPDSCNTSPPDWELHSHTRTLPALQIDIVPYGAAQNTYITGNMHCPQCHPLAYVY